MCENGLYVSLLDFAFVIEIYTLMAKSNFILICLFFILFTPVFLRQYTMWRICHDDTKSIVAFMKHGRYTVIY